MIIDHLTFFWKRMTSMRTFFLLEEETTDEVSLLEEIYKHDGEQPNYHR